MHDGQLKKNKQSPQRGRASQQINECLRPQEKSFADYLTSSVTSLQAVSTGTDTKDGAEQFSRPEASLDW